MKTLDVLKPDEAVPQTKEIFDKLKKKLGRIPNIYAAMGHSPAALKALLSFSETLGSGVLSPKDIEAVALVVGEDNDCGYCIAAHTAVAKKVGFTEDETLSLRKGKSDDPKLNALAALAKEISANRGRPDEASIQAFFSASYDKAALVELIGFVCLNLFTNYFNHIVEPPIDFPAALELS